MNAWDRKVCHLMVDSDIRNWVLSDWLHDSVVVRLDPARDGCKDFHQAISCIRSECQVKCR